MIEFCSERFLLRELQADDATENYLSWLHDADAMKFIAAAQKTKVITDLRQYIVDRTNQEDILFLGIFDKNTLQHIGNIKYEPVNSFIGYAIMGILIGELSYRNKGVGSEVISASARWLNKYRGIRQILLGVTDENMVAIKSYERVGFIISDSFYLQKTVPEHVIMTLHVSG